MLFNSAKAQHELGYTIRPYQKTIHDEVRWVIKKDQIEK